MTFLSFSYISASNFREMRKFFFAKIRKRKFFASTLTGAQTWHRRHTLLPYTHCCLHSIRTAPSQLYMRTAYGVYMHTNNTIKPNCFLIVYSYSTNRFFNRRSGMDAVSCVCTYIAAAMTVWHDINEYEK